jgi:hypothetical protein
MNTSWRDCSIREGQTVESKPDTFYGYYTFEVLNKDGRTAGMLSTNGYSGRVSYHTWHGKFVGALA